MRHDEGSLTADDGIEIYHQSWRPDGDARSAVMLIHGLGEHSGRYGHVAAALVDAGCVVHALDHRGHGKSGGKRVFVRSYGEFMRDLAMFRRHVRTTDPDLPLVVLGHSMGGNLALGHVIEAPEGVAALAVSAPALTPGSGVSPIQIKLASLIAKVAPGFRPEGLDASTISRDPAVVEAYRNDPLVFTGKISAGLGAALFDSMERLPAAYPDLRLPLLIMHGTGDRLVDIAGSKALEAGAVNADVTAHYYDGLYHEVFNEPEQNEVLGDLVSWLESTLA